MGRCGPADDASRRRRLRLTRVSPRVRACSVKLRLSVDAMMVFESAQKTAATTSAVLRATWTYFRTVAHFACGGRLSDAPTRDPLCRVFLFSLLASLRLWNCKHYRSPSYAAGECA